MSIDAVVKTVIINEDGSGRLELIDRPARHGQSDGIAGQKALSFDCAPEEVTGLNWLPVWGSSNSLILGDRKIADRVDYTRVKFVDRASFILAMIDYHKSKAE